MLYRCYMVHGEKVSNAAIINVVLLVHTFLPTQPPSKDGATLTVPLTQQSPFSSLMRQHLLQSRHLLLIPHDLSLASL